MKTPTLIYEDKNFLAVDKPAGLLVHSAAKDVRPNTEERTLVDWLLEKYPAIAGVGDEPKLRPGIVHRLDRDTSGILLVPKTQEYYDYLKDLFQTHQIQKKYLAIVYGKVKPPKGVIDKPIGILTGSVKRSVRSEKMRKEAVTEYAVKKYFMLGGEEMSLVEVMPKTGRTHQIRIHLASIGHPVLGDRLYSGRSFRRIALQNPPLNKVSRQMLHAESLEFAPAPGERLTLSADLPADMAGLLSGF